MTNKPYDLMSNSELVKLFEQICLIQYDTFISGDVKLYNKNYDIQTKIKNELKARGPEARRSLLVLLKHENPQVRLQAAERVYPVAQAEALRCLQELASAGLMDQTLAARMTLRRLKEVPDCLDH